MDKQAPIVGNLALKPDWDRLSESEADCSYELESQTAPSGILQKGKPVFTTSRREVVRFQPLASVTAGEHPVSVGSPDLFEAAGIIVEEPTSHNIVTVAPNILDDITIRLEGVTSKMYLASSEGESRLISHFIAGQFAFRSWSNVSFVEGQCSTSITSLAGSLSLLRTERSDKQGDTLGILAIQIRKLHDEFAQWPGSYNQLLLAGSLDYCKSALTKAMKSNVVLHEEIIRCMKSYYADCLGILDQCSDAKTTLRRLNLQKIQDKFEILQDTCSRLGIYPRLAEVGISDIPGE